MSRTTYIHPQGISKSPYKCSLPFPVGKLHPRSCKLPRTSVPHPRQRAAGGLKLGEAGGSLGASEGGGTELTAGHAQALALCFEREARRACKANGACVALSTRHTAYVSHWLCGALRCCRVQAVPTSGVGLRHRLWVVETC